MPGESLESLRSAALAALAQLEKRDWELGRVLSGDCRAELDQYLLALREARARFEKLETALLQEFIERRVE